MIKDEYEPLDHVLMDNEIKYLLNHYHGIFSLGNDLTRMPFSNRICDFLRKLPHYLVLEITNDYRTVDD